MSNQESTNKPVDNSLDSNTDVSKLSVFPSSSNPTILEQVESEQIVIMP